MCNALVPSSSCRGGRRRRIFLMISNTALMLGLSVTLLQSSVSVIDKATLMMWQFFVFFLSKTKTRRSHNLSAKVATELLKQGVFFFWPNKAFFWKLATKMNLLNVEMAHLCSWRLLKNSFEVIGIWLAFTLEVCPDTRLQHSLYEATGYHKTNLN